jgi:hypothetical protein
MLCCGSFVIQEYERRRTSIVELLNVIGSNSIFLKNVERLIRDRHLHGDNPQNNISAAVAAKKKDEMNG